MKTRVVYDDWLVLFSMVYVYIWFIDERGIMKNKNEARVIKYISNIYI